MSEAASGHFVYLFRDRRGKARYCGYGKSPERAVSHISGSHRPELERFLRTEKYILEVAGPFGDRRTGLAVETALITALNPEFNRARGSSGWRFRPIGVREEFADRLVDLPMKLSDLHSVATRTGGILFVHISSEDFEYEDGSKRPGYKLTELPHDPDVLRRMEKWWQIGRMIQRWLPSPDSGPALLVGIHGRPGYQVIIGAVRIDTANWSTSIRKDGLHTIPTKGPKNLDAFSLRGRRISRKAGLSFGPNKCEFFIWLRPSGRLFGGRQR